MKYSFVLPAYKGKFLKQAIDSILSQTYTDFELIVVNDASPDDLDSIVGLYRDSRIRYYKNSENIGGNNLVAQWNHCLSYVDSEYIILASDDDVYMHTYLEKMNSLVERYPNVNIFRPRVQHIDAQGNVIGIESLLNEYVDETEYHYYWYKNWIFRGIPYYIFRLSVIKQVGGFHYYPLAWCCDDDIVMRLVGNGLVSSHDVLFSFRMSGESITTRKSSIRDVKLKMSAIYKYYTLLKNRLDLIKIADVSGYKSNMLFRLKMNLNARWINNEISCLCYKISYKELILLTRSLMSYDTINFAELIKIHIRYIKRSLFC